MNLNLFNNILNNAKENSFVQNFIKELTVSLERKDEKLSGQENSLKEENCLYQVVDMNIDGAYLQNINNNQVFKETDISKEVLDKIGNDTVLRYQNGEYIIEEELTQEILNNLVEIKKYKEIQDNFTKQSNISKIDANTKYKIEKKDKKYTILSYESDGKFTIKVPNELIPFWANSGEKLYYKNGKFNRDL